MSEKDNAAWSQNTNHYKVNITAKPNHCMKRILKMST